MRVEVGPRDIEAGQVTLVRRIGGTKAPVALADVIGAVTSALEADQKALYDEALTRREANTIDVSTLDEAIEAAGRGWARIGWDQVGTEGEAKANQSAISVRCLYRADGSAPASQDEPGLTAILARSY